MPRDDQDFSTEAPESPYDDASSYGRDDGDEEDAAESASEAGRRGRADGVEELTGLDDEQRELVLRWLESEEGRRELNRRARSVLEQTRRDLRKVLAGDKQAERFLAREGKRLLHLFREREQDLRSQAEQEKLQEIYRFFLAEPKYRELIALRDEDPAEFARQVFDPEVRAFLDRMQRLEAEARQFAGLGPTTGAGRPTANRERDGASRLMDVYDELHDIDQAELLSDEDWDELHPDNFTDVSPQTAAKRMRQLFYSKLVERSKGRATGRRTTGRPVAEEEEQETAARPRPVGAVRPPSGRPAATPGGGDAVELYLTDPTNPAARAAYERYRKRLGYS